MKLLDYVTENVTPFIGLPQSMSPVDATRAMIRERLIDRQNDCEDLRDVELCDGGDVTVLVHATDMEVQVGLLHVTFIPLTPGGQDWLEVVNAPHAIGLTFTLVGGSLR